MVDMNQKKLYDIVHPICCTQKIAVYETRTVSNINVCHERDFY